MKISSSPIKQRSWLFACGVLVFTFVNRFFKPNISRHGRMARGVIGALCLVVGIIVAGDYSLWGLILVSVGLFALFEAIRGWCLMRACGIKTKL